MFVLCIAGSFFLDLIYVAVFSVGLFVSLAVVPEFLISLVVH